MGASKIIPTTELGYITFSMLERCTVLNRNEEITGKMFQEKLLN